MNRCSAAFIAICALLVTSASFASEKPRIGVADFRNDTAAGWWYGGAGSDLSSMLTNELSSTEKFRVVEPKRFRLADHDPADTAGLDIDKEEAKRRRGSIGKVDACTPQATCRRKQFAQVGPRSWIGGAPGGWS